VTPFVLAASAALAQSTGPVQAIVWAQAFVLAVPESDPNGPPSALGAWAPATFTRGYLIELRADPALLRPSNYAEPLLYVGDQRATKLNWDHEGGCLVAIVSERPDLAAVPMFLGAPPRPADDRKAVARAEAERLGVRPLPAAEVARALAAGGPERSVRDLRDVYAAGMARVAACSRTPSDLQRGGR
jgi:hypothetical protein